VTRIVGRGRCTEYGGGEDGSAHLDGIEEGYVTGTVMPEEDRCRAIYRNPSLAIQTGTRQHIPPIACPIPLQYCAELRTASCGIGSAAKGMEHISSGIWRGVVWIPADYCTTTLLCDLSLQRSGGSRWLFQDTETYQRIKCSRSLTNTNGQSARDLGHDFEGNS